MAYKTVIVKCFAGGSYQVGQTTYNPATGGHTLQPAKPFTTAEKEFFRIVTAGEIMQKAIDEAKRIITSTHYFVVDPKLWKWEANITDYRMDLLLFLTFTDEDQLGKTAFMNKINATGLLDRECYIIKPYS